MKRLGAGALCCLQAVVFVECESCGVMRQEGADQMHVCEAPAPRRSSARFIYDDDLQDAQDPDAYDDDDVVSFMPSPSKRQRGDNGIVLGTALPVVHVNPLPVPVRRRTKRGVKRVADNAADFAARFMDDNEQRMADAVQDVFGTIRRALQDVATRTPGIMLDENAHSDLTAALTTFTARMKWEVAKVIEVAITSQAQL